MVASTLLTTIGIVLTSTSGATDAAEDYVQASKNGQFLSDFYPEGAAQRGEEGRVAFKLTIEREGWIGACEVTESSGFKALDRETCEIMVQYAKLQPARRADGKPIKAVRDGHIVWKLPAGRTKAMAAVATKFSKPDPLICRRDARAGSNVGKTIQCLTRKEWELQEDFTREKLQEIQGKGYSRG